MEIAFKAQLSKRRLGISFPDRFLAGKCYRRTVGLDESFRHGLALYAGGLRLPGPLNEFVVAELRLERYDNCRLAAALQGEFRDTELQPVWPLGHLDLIFTRSDTLTSYVHDILAIGRIIADLDFGFVHHDSNVFVCGFNDEFAPVGLHVNDPTGEEQEA